MQTDKPFTLVPLFPSPLYIKQLEIGDIDLSKIDWDNNVHNLASEDASILDTEPFKQLKKEINICLQEYFHEVLKVVDETEIFITRSWVNKMVKDNWFHYHTHPNSIVSGVFYFDDADDKTTETIFGPLIVKSWEFKFKEPNLYNAQRFAVTPKKNKIVLFPSEMPHYGEQHKSDKERFTLSFNSFVRGFIHDNGPVELTIKK